MFSSSHLGFCKQDCPGTRPTQASPRVLVIGAGIIGLSIAWTLLDSGFNVTVLAENGLNRDGERLTSQIAGALWEYPPAVCGHYDEALLEKSKRWAMVSYHVFRHMAENTLLSDHFGVQMRETVFFFQTRVVDDAEQQRKMQEIESSGVLGFEHNRAIIRDYDLVDANQWRDAYKMLSPMIDTDHALARIAQLVESKGAIFEFGKKVEGDLLPQESELLNKYDAKVIVNASGLGAYDLADDKTVYPLHGAVLRVRNDGKRFPRINQALVVSAPATLPQETSEFVFIVPRNDHILYVGGFSEPIEMPLKNSNWRIALHDERIERIRQKAAKFLQVPDALSFDHLDEAYPLAQGLRPARLGGVRLEREDRRAGSRIVHCYGHAGSGWSLSFGCALEVKTLVRGVIAELESGVSSESIKHQPGWKGTVISEASAELGIDIVSDVY